MPIESMSVVEAAAAIDKLDGGEEPTNPVPAAEQQESAEQEPEANASEEAEETPTEETTETEEPVTRFDELAEHLNVEPEFLQNLIVPTKVNGKEVTPTIKDLLSHYSKGESADSRLMEAAEQSKRFEQEMAAERQKLQQEWDRINSMQEQLDTFLQPDEDLSLLRENDPAEYVARMAERMDQRQQAERMKLQIQQEQAQKINENYQKVIQQESTRLRTFIPEWNDESVAAKERGELGEYLKNMGFQDWEIYGRADNGVIQHPGIIDARVIAVARKAMLADKTTESAKPKKARLATLPKVSKGQRISKEDEKVGKVESLKKRARSSGTLDDAAALIRELGI